MVRGMGSEGESGVELLVGREKDAISPIRIPFSGSKEADRSNWPFRWDW